MVRKVEKDMERIRKNIEKYKGNWGRERIRSRIMIIFFNLNWLKNIELIKI